MSGPRPVWKGLLKISLVTIPILMILAAPMRGQHGAGVVASPWPAGYRFHDPATIQARVLDFETGDPIIGADVIVANGHVGRATTTVDTTSGSPCPRCARSAEVTIPVHWYWENAERDAAGPFTELDLWAYKKGYKGAPNNGGMTQTTIIVRPSVVSRLTLYLQVEKQL